MDFRDQLDIHDEDISPDEIAALRERLDMTQKEFGEFLGVEQNTVGRWESNKMDHTPSGRNREQLKLVRAILDNIDETARQLSQEDKEAIQTLLNPDSSDEEGLKKLLDSDFFDLSGAALGGITSTLIPAGANLASLGLLAGNAGSQLMKVFMQAMAEYANEEDQEE